MKKQNEIYLVEEMIKYLKSKKVKFKNNLPILKKEWMATSLPKRIVPFSKRNYVNDDKSNISICFFDKDSNIYPRLYKVMDEISIYKNYHSICMMDISISPLMDEPLQNFNLLLNLCFTSILGVNGIKIIPSTRCGNEHNLMLLKDATEGSDIWISGLIGTQKDKKNEYIDLLFIIKLNILPIKKLLLYGKPNIDTTNILDNNEIDYIIYDDFRRYSFNKKRSD